MELAGVWRVWCGGWRQRWDTRVDGMSGGSEPGGKTTRLAGGYVVLSGIKRGWRGRARMKLGSVCVCMHGRVCQGWGDPEQLTDASEPALWRRGGLGFI